jgi:hypothetical protein
MARPKTLTVTSADIQRLEGLAQSLGDTDPAYRPKTEAVDFVAKHLGVRRRVVQDWVRLVRPSSRRNDTAEAFLGVYERIASLLSEVLESRMWSIAQPGARDAFRALQWLLPRVDPERFDPAVANVEENGDDVFDTANIPQEVFDAMSDEQREQLAEFRQQVLDALTGYEHLIKTVQSRLLTAELAEERDNVQG